MITSGTRICDICGSEIPKGEAYRKSAIPSEAAVLLLDTTDLDTVPSMTQGMDGMVHLDICLECHLAMGTTPNAIEAH